MVCELLLFVVWQKVKIPVFFVAFASDFTTFAFCRFSAASGKLVRSARRLPRNPSLRSHPLLLPLLPPRHLLFLAPPLQPLAPLLLLVQPVSPRSRSRSRSRSLLQECRKRDADLSTRDGQTTLAASERPFAS